MTPQTKHLLQFFSFAHLPQHLQGVSRGFGELAYQIADALPDGPEKTVALRKLLEAKDAGVRAVLSADEELLDGVVSRIAEDLLETTTAV